MPISSFSKKPGPKSPEALFTPALRLTAGRQPKSSWMWARHATQMSKSPRPPGRLVAKKRKCPSRDSSGERSLKAVLMAAPRLTGASQGASLPARRETQRSSPPSDPGRSDAK